MSFEPKGVINVSTGVATAVKIPGGMIAVRLEAYDENDLNSTLYVKATGDSYPSVGDRGLILFTGSSRDDGYWLGQISGRFQTENGKPKEDYRAKLPDGMASIFSENGRGRMLAGQSDCIISQDGTELKISSSSVLINNTNKFKLSIDQNGFSVATFRKGIMSSMFSVAERLIEINSNGTILTRTRGDMILRAGGNVMIQGDSTEEKPCTMLWVRAGKVAIDAGAGPVSIQASAFNVKLSSSKLGTSSGIPGTGPMTAASIEALQGNIDVSSGVGNLTFRALSPAHKVKMVNAFTIIGPQSFFEASGISAKMGAEMLTGLGSYIECSRSGSMSIKAFRNIETTSVLGSIKLSSLLGMELATKLTMSIKATMKAEIEAGIAIAMKTLMLDLKQVKMIQAGPKTVAPTGQGPFCGLPMCLFTGAPHSGHTAVG